MLEAPGGDAHLTIGFHEVGPAAGQAADALLGRLAQQFPHPKRSEFFPVFALNETGIACEVEWTSTQGTRLWSRCAVVPFPGGHLEVVLTAPGEKFQTQEQVAWSPVLLSLRRAPKDAKLELPRVTPE